MRKKNRRIKEKDNIVIEPEIMPTDFSIKDDAVKNDTVEVEIMPRKIKIPELARQLEDGIISSTSLSDRGKRGCVLFFKSIKYQPEDIATILNVSVRQIQRYCKKNKEEVASILDPHFQKSLMVKIMNRWNARLQRLIRLSYAKDLSSYERARIISMCHQIDVDSVAILDRYGYVSREQTKNDMVEEASSRQLAQMHRFEDRLRPLTKSQQAKVWKFIGSASSEEILGDDRKEFDSKLNKMINDFIEENERTESLDEFYKFKAERQSHLVENVVTNCAADIYVNIAFKKATETTS